MIPDFTPPRREDIPGYPKGSEFDWVQRLLEPYTKHIRLLTQEIQKFAPQVTNQETKTVRVRHALATEVTTSVKGRVSGVTLVSFPSPATLTSVQPKGVGAVEITVEFDDEDPAEREVAVLIQGT